MRIVIIAVALIAASTTAQARNITLGVAGRANSTPWVAASGSFVAAVWTAAAGGKGDVMLAISRDDGRTFAAPVRVNSREGDARISGEIAPRVALQPRPNADPIVIVTWNARDAATQIKTARSVDGGRTFAAPASLQTAGAAGDRGWQAAAVDAKGALHAIWLDHRGMAGGARGHEAHKGEHDGVAMAQKSGLYYASPGNRAERELFTGVCYCCKTALAVGPNGHIYAAWRHVFANNMRDIAFTVSRDGGATFAPLARINEDKWSINGCPDDGPAIAVDGSGLVHVVWPTVLNGTEGALLYTTTKDGQRFAAPIRIPTLGSPKPSHPQIAANAKGQVIVAWDEVIGGVRKAAARTLSMRGERVEFGEMQSLGDGTATYPVIAGASRGWVAVWSTGGANSQVRATVLK